MADGLQQVLLTKFAVKQWKKVRNTRVNKRRLLREKAKEAGHDVKNDPTYDDAKIRRQSLIAFNGEVFKILEEAYQLCAREDGNVYEQEYCELLGRVCDEVAPDMTHAERKIILKEEVGELVKVGHSRILIIQCFISC